MALYFESELLQAVEDEDVNAVITLLEAGADPNAGLFKHETAISKAISTGNEEILDLLLRNGSLQCMIEEQPCAAGHWLQKRRSATRRSTLRGLALLPLTKIGLDCAAAWLHGVRCQHLLRLGGHYLWFVARATISGPVSLAELRSRYLKPLTYAETVVEMLFGNQLYNWMVRRLLSFVPSLAMPLGSDLGSNMRHDLLLAIPLRFAVDCMVTAVHTLFRQLPYKLGRSASGPDVYLILETESWKSPAERAFESIMVSDKATETIVHKLLRAGILASRPFKNSPVAKSLLRSAIIRCWPTVTEFLLDTGMLLNGQSWLSSASRHWPALISAIEYYAPNAALDDLSGAFVKTESIPRASEEYEYDEFQGPFLVLVKSPNFIRLATSDTVTGHKTCIKMLDTLFAHGADPLRCDGRDLDALCHVASSSISTTVFQHIVYLWQRARYKLPIIPGDSDPPSQALHQAVSTASPDLGKVRILLDMGMSPEWENHEGQTPLFEAAFANSNIEAMSMLLEAGASPNNGGKEAYPPLAKTLDDASLVKFEFLLAYGADPNATGKGGKSILENVVELHSSLSVPKYYAVESLLRHGVAVYNESTELAPAFIAMARQLNCEGWDEVILGLLLHEIPREHRSRQLNLALQAAVSDKGLNRGDFVTLSYLLCRGADPSCLQGGTTFILEYICSLVRPLNHQFRDHMRRFLQEYHPNVNSCNDSGNTPLSHTIRNGSRDFSLLLLEHQADPNAVNAECQTPLQQLSLMKPWTYSIGHSHEQVYGADNDQRYQGVRGQSALRVKVKERLHDISNSLAQEEVFQCLVDHGADLGVRDSTGQSLLMLACANGNDTLAANILYCLRETEFIPALTETNKSGKTSLHLAATSGSLNTIRILLAPHHILKPATNTWRKMAMDGESNHIQQRKHEAGYVYEHLEKQVDQYMKRAKDTPGFLVRSVAWVEDYEVEITAGDAERMDILLPNVAASTWQLQKQDMLHTVSETLRDSMGKTPLHCAALMGHVEVVRLLLEYTDVDIDAKDVDGKTAADIALDGNFYDVYGALQFQDEQC
ncbi:ankyrin [Cucurbitaria berberidis CBS 394.84]|uniref:Ankyrin n=1 Tax=Cucurbitaria berberidis CBS 394.84 TaxID=1168544 RepID=A0A9P4GTE6_9PLEO|nr:ankyrin [Cucurbitaria berberidis CBS 394.84]KAF1852223.1 ankyrin [Cucurbitaria berberidis CBS 394.84]